MNSHIPPPLMHSLKIRRKMEQPLHSSNSVKTTISLNDDLSTGNKTKEMRRSMFKLMFSLSALVCLSLAFVFSCALLFISTEWFREFLVMIGYFEPDGQVILSTAEVSMKVSVLVCVFLWALCTALCSSKKQT